jgi:hypothetical protein
MILLFYLDGARYLTKSSVARRFFPNPAKDFQVLEALVTCPKKFQFIVRDIMPDPLPATDIQIVRLQLQLLCKPPLTIHDSRPTSEPQLGRFPRLRSAKPRPEQIQSVLNDHLLSPRLPRPGLSLCSYNKL